MTEALTITPASWAAAVMLAASLPIATANESKVEIARLADDLGGKGIPLTKAGIGRYLRDLTDSERERPEVEKLILQLGSDRFIDRDIATRSLMTSQTVPSRMLREATGSSDPEVASRARQILDYRTPRQRRMVQRIFRGIEVMQLSGLEEEIFATAIMFGDERAVLMSAKRAMSAVAAAGDIPFLSSQMSPETAPPGRDLAIHALRELRDATLADKFERWSRNSELEERTRLESALALADFGDRRALRLLAEMMIEARSAGVRVRSHAALQQLAGQSFAYNPHEPREVRIERAEVWNRWIESDGGTAALSFPLKPGSGLNGHTLLALCERNRVVEYDEAMNEIWSYPFRRPYTAERMANGNVLISSYAQNRIVEVNPDKEIVWELEVEQVESARSLDNGNILVTSNQSQEIQEINPGGDVVWRAQTGEFFTDAIRLENGNTLAVESTTEPRFGHSYIVVEFNAEGDRVWERRTFNKLMPFIQALGNGNVLIAQDDEVIEVDRDSDEVVWQLEIDQSRGGALKLDSGNLLIRQYSRILEVTPEGTEIWSKDDVSFGSMRR